MTLHKIALLLCVCCLTTHSDCIAEDSRDASGQLVDLLAKMPLLNATSYIATYKETWQRGELPQASINEYAVDIPSQKYAIDILNNDQDGVIHTLYQKRYIDGVLTVFSQTALSGGKIVLKGQNTEITQPVSRNATLKQQGYDAQSALERLLYDPFTTRPIVESLIHYKNQLSISLHGEDVILAGPYFEFTFDRQTKALKSAAYYIRNKDNPHLKAHEFIASKYQNISGVQIPVELEIKHFDGEKWNSYKAALEEGTFKLNPDLSAVITPITLPVGTYVTDHVTRKEYRISGFDKVGQTSDSLTRVLDNITNRAKLEGASSTGNQ